MFLYARLNYVHLFEKWDIMLSRLWGKVSAKDLKKYMMYHHQIWQKHQSKMKNKFEPGDHKDHLMRQHMQDGFYSVSEEIFDVSSPILGHQGKETKFKPRDLDLNFKVTKVI